MMKPLRGPALNEAVRDYIKQYILEHGLNGGDPLPPETQWAQELGVGRSSVREAIKALQSLGIVEVRHGNGLFVREYNFDPVLETLSYGMRLDTTTLAELAQIRIWLEASVIMEAVKQITPHKIAQLKTVMQAWANRIAHGQPSPDLDEQFHRILYESLNNQTLIKLLETFWIAFKNLEVALPKADISRLTLRQHQAILDAIEAGDAALTRQRLIEHFGPLQERIRQMISPDEILVETIH
jgi:DNA-binding FadR family transcriptional regulator